MTSDDVKPLRGTGYAPPAGWSAVSASADPFPDTVTQPNTTRVARCLLFTATGSVTFTSIDGSSTVLALGAAWDYPVILPGMFTHVTAISGTTVFAGWF